MRKLTSAIICLMIISTLILSVTINSKAINYADDQTNYMQMIINSTSTGDIESVKYYIEARNNKISSQGLNSCLSFTYDDLFCLAATIYQESGAGAYVSDNEMLCQGNVIINRTHDSRFPSTVRGVLEAPNQYANFCSNGVNIVDRGNSQLEIDAINRSYQIALRVLNGERAWNGYEYCPDNILYASQGWQGTEVWWICGRTWFCFG